MGFSSADKDSPTHKVRKARYMRGKCGICFEMIMPGEEYAMRDGSRTRNVQPVHVKCYFPQPGNSGQ